MSAGMVFTVGYLSLYIDFPEKVILGKHIFDITVYLTYRICVFHSDFSSLSLLQSCQGYRLQRNRKSHRQTVGKLYRLIDSYTCRYIFVIFQFIHCQTQGSQVNAAHSLCLQPLLVSFNSASISSNFSSTWRYFRLIYS